MCGRAESEKGTPLQSSIAVLPVKYVYILAGQVVHSVWAKSSEYDPKAQGVQNPDDVGLTVAL